MKNMYKVLSFILFSTALFCQFSGGTGALEDPYQITTATQLNSVRNYNGDAYSETYFLMVNDIDLSGYSPWIPMCDWFRAHFDGGNNTITGLLIDNAEGDYVGLFKELYNGNIRNLNIESASVTGREYVGVICGYVFSGNVSNCHSSGTVNGVNYLGGIIGYVNQGNITVCSFDGDLAGELTYDWIISDGGYVSDGQYIGGIAGELVSGTVDRCYSKGSIKGGMQLGGLIGQTGGTVSDSYSMVSIFDETDYYSGVSYSEDIGGLIGYSSSNTSRSYSCGHVEGSSYRTGGLIGYSMGTETDCFWDVNASGRTESAGGTGKTTAEMKTITTFTDAGWDFTTVWDMEVLTNDGYPYLSWEYPSGIEDSESVTNDFELYQNYPNPFNPVTSIQYSLANAAQVELNVYNLRGQLVQNLVNGKEDRGVYQVNFDGSDLTSGIHIYELKVDGKYTASKKMTIIK